MIVLKNANALTTVKIAGICALSSQAAAILLLLLFGFLLKNADDPERLIPALSLLTAAIASLAAGFSAACFDDERPILCGFLCGAASAGLSLAFSVLPGGEKPLIRSLLLIALTVLCCTGGALVRSALRKKTARVVRRRKRKSR